MKRLSPRERFYTKFKVMPSGCWEWQDFRNLQGYGTFRVTGFTERLAHRFSYSWHHGPLLKGMCVMHTCDNPPCVNPDHLVAGNRDLNNKDRAAKGRNNHRNEGLIFCKRGHDLRIHANHRPNGGRYCKVCAHDRYIASKKNA